MSDNGKTPQAGDEAVSAREESLIGGKVDIPVTVRPLSQEGVEQTDAIGPVESDILPDAGRSVAFPVETDNDLEEKPTGGLNRPRGVEMRRELTMEERELAQAGYDHLEEQKEVPANKGDDELDKVDIQEHRLKFDELENALETSIVTKDPSESRGLQPKEVAERLARDGKNVLTPPKKKSAFRKVSASFHKDDDSHNDVF